MENFVILAKLPSPWPTKQEGGDGGGRSTMPTTSPVKAVEQTIDTFGGRIETIAALEGRFDLLVIAEMPNHEAALKVAFYLGQLGYKTETSVAIDPGTVTHAWESVQQQAATSRR